MSALQHASQSLHFHPVYSFQPGIGQHCLCSLSHPYCNKAAATRYHPINHQFCQTVLATRAFSRGSVSTLLLQLAALHTYNKAVVTNQSSILPKQFQLQQSFSMPLTLLPSCAPLLGGVTVAGFAVCAGLAFNKPKVFCRQPTIFLLCRIDTVFPLAALAASCNNIIYGW
jgi:hypothetical protein